MSPAIVTLILGILGLLAQMLPVITPKIKEIFEIIKGVEVQDITHDELCQRVDAAIEKLPVWT